MDRKCIGRDGYDLRETQDAQAYPPPVHKSPGCLQPLESIAQRTMLGWTLADMAVRSGFPEATIAEFEAGRRSLSLSARVALQRVLRRGSQVRKA